jgi:hypothetical protein
MSILSCSNHQFGACLFPSLKQRLQIIALHQGQDGIHRLDEQAHRINALEVD